MRPKNLLEASLSIELLISFFQRLFTQYNLKQPVEANSLETYMHLS